MVLLEPMSEDLFQDYLRSTLTSYAEALVKAGNWEVSESVQRAEEQLRELLPQGSHTEGHNFLKIVDEITNEKVGVLWFAEVDDEDEKVVFLYDLIVDAHFRHQGYGKQAMSTLEGRISILGLSAIHLHVFAYNKVAKSLYDKLGYEIVKTYYDEVNNMATSFRMAKTVRITS